MAVNKKLATLEKTNQTFPKKHSTYIVNSRAPSLLSLSQQGQNAMTIKRPHAVLFRHLEDHLFSDASRQLYSKCCFSALLKGFACMDGLGLIAHCIDKKVEFCTACRGVQGKRHVGNEDRFRACLQRLGKLYEKKVRRLWDLRCNLSHTLVNEATILSHVETEKCNHLREAGEVLFVHTEQFLHDLEIAFLELKEELKNDSRKQDIADRALESEGILQTQRDNPFPSCETTLPPNMSS